MQLLVGALGLPHCETDRGGISVDERRFGTALPRHNCR